MPTYDQWNRALIAHFVDAAAPGAPVYLSADDDVLAEVGRQLGLPVDAGGATALRDFQAAVRARTLGAGGRLDLSGVEGTDALDEPRSAAFLSALVLAVTRMHDDGDLGDLNYFGRLREVLGLPAETGRPRGMEVGSESEEPLWKSWNFWLQVRGHLASATSGEGPQRFIHYARSQALLREVDKDRLRRLFHSRRWTADLDAEALLLRVRREAQALTVHLGDLLASDSDRLALVAAAVHDLYERWRLDPSGVSAPSSGHRRLLYAGLYREVEPYSGDVTYALYPRSLAGMTATMRARAGDVVWTLDPDPQQPGTYHPVGPIDGATLAHGARYAIEQPAGWDALMLPARAFWILAADPESPEWGAYASRGQPRLGQPFIILCRAEALSQVRGMQRERLIECDPEPRPVLDGAWYEFRDCEIASEAWSGAHLANPELYDALRPVDMCSVSASGGLRLPDRPGWLDEAGPQIAVSGFAPDAEVTITDVKAGRVVLERAQRTGEAMPVAWPGPGAYLVEAVCAGQRARRMVAIGSWDELQLAEPSMREAIAIGAVWVSGAAID